MTVGAGCDLRQGIELRKLRARHPRMHVNDIAMHFRQHRRSAPDCDEGQHQEIQEQRTELCDLHQCAPFHAATMASGASTANTARSGQRMTPTPTNASTTNSHGSAPR